MDYIEDDLLWEAEGVVHRIALIEVGNQGVAILQVSRIRGSSYESATLTPEERYSLAKALYPEAFTDNQSPLKDEYGVQDRNGRMVKDHAYTSPSRARLIGIEETETFMVRKVSPWKATNPPE